MGSYAWLLIFHFLEAFSIQTLNVALSVGCMSLPNLILPSTLCLHSKHLLATDACYQNQILLCLPSDNLPGRLTPSTQENSVSNLLILFLFSGSEVFIFLSKCSLFKLENICELILLPYTSLFYFFPKSNIIHLFSILCVRGFCPYAYHCTTCVDGFSQIRKVHWIP